jgi:DNA-directed RNA polymerase subunit RPC12/RpoP
MKKVLLSLTLTLLVSGLFGIIFKDWFVFGLVTILQILFFYFFNTVYENYLTKKVVEANAIVELEKLKNTVRVTCPCGSSQEVLLSMTEDTIYRCDECKNEIRAAVNIGTALVTTPINVSSTSPTITKV